MWLETSTLCTSRGKCLPPRRDEILYRPWSRLGLGYQFSFHGTSGVGTKRDDFLFIFFGGNLKLNKLLLTGCTVMKSTEGRMAFAMGLKNMVMCYTLVS
jgi:hypothetical protein